MKGKSWAEWSEVVLKILKKKKQHVENQIPLIPRKNHHFIRVLSVQNIVLHLSFLVFIMSYSCVDGEIKNQLKLYLKNGNKSDICSEPSFHGHQMWIWVKIWLFLVL